MTGAFHETIPFEMIKLSAQAHVPALFVGAHEPSIELIDNHVIGGLVAKINAFVISEKGGPTVHDEVTVTIPGRPWWLPKFVWRRCPQFEKQFSLDVRPMWTYPESGLQFDALGRGVKFAQTFRPIPNSDDGEDR